LGRWPARSCAGCGSLPGRNCESAYSRALPRSMPRPSCTGGGSSRRWKRHHNMSPFQRNDILGRLSLTGQVICIRTLFTPLARFPVGRFLAFLDQTPCFSIIIPWVLPVCRFLESILTTLLLPAIRSLPLSMGNSALTYTEECLQDRAPLSAKPDQFRLGQRRSNSEPKTLPSAAPRSSWSPWEIRTYRTPLSPKSGTTRCIVAIFQFLLARSNS